MLRYPGKFAKKAERVTGGEHHRSLLEKGISIIGLDFVGARREPEHTAKDQYCADRGVFIVENLRNLGAITLGKKSATCIINTYPINFSGQTGLPCRVVAERR